MNRFDHRTAVVTGAASGIGAAIAAALHGEGAEVVWIDRDPAVEEIAKRHDCVGVVGDVSDLELPRRVLELIRKHAEGLDHFVAAAGIQVRTAGVEIDEADWERLIGINLSSVYRFIRTFAPALKTGSAGTPGNVLVVSSMAADRAVPGIVPYGATKSALSHLIRGLAVELGPSGVRLNGIAPGYVSTPMVASRLADDKARTRILERLPLRRLGDPAEMAGPALFLMSNDARYVTGQILAVDGGYALT